jgi:hypothetical protein
MTKNEARAVELTAKHLFNCLSWREKIELDEWINASPANRLKFEGITNQENFKRKFRHYASVDLEAAWYRTMQKMAEADAAVRSRSLLSLASGRKIFLDEAKNGVIAQEGDYSIRKEDQQVVYTPGKRHSHHTAKETIPMNVLTTSVDSNCELLLADGSKISVDGGSTLRYPVWFDGRVQNLEFTGNNCCVISKSAFSPLLLNVNGSLDVRYYNNKPYGHSFVFEGIYRLGKKLAKWMGVQPTIDIKLLPAGSSS